MGRRTLALEIARSYNCVGGSNVPCAVCNQCIRISRGLHVDTQLIGLEQADEEHTRRKRRISIEMVHRLQQDAWLKPFEGTWRTFVIDGAELISNEGSNALLKTLEEPPPNVVIVLVASEYESLLPTIVSRCMKVDLRLVPAPIIEEGLIKQYGASSDIAKSLSLLARGRPGWAIKALKDPAMVSMNEQSTYRAEEMATGTLEERLYVARVLSDKWRRSSEEVIEELDWWLWWWRDLALVKAGVASGITHLSNKENLAGISHHITIEEAAQGIEALIRVREALEANCIPRLALEVLALDLPFISRN